MKTAIIIPARYASSRLPGKPLLRQTGKYLVQHVYERACQAQKAGTVLVATDDPRIVTAVESFGGRVVLTRRDPPPPPPPATPTPTSSSTFRATNPSSTRPPSTCSPSCSGATPPPTWPPSP